MASFDETRSKTNDGFEMQCSEKAFVMETQQTEKDDSVQGVPNEVIADTKNDSKNQNTQLAGTQAVYESLTTKTVRQQKLVSRFTKSLRSLLLLLVFVTAVASLALALSERNSPSDSSRESRKGSTEGGTLQVTSEKMKGEIFTDKNQALNVTRLELNKLKRRVEEMDVNSLVKELTRQLNELRKRVGDVKVNSTLAVNELKKQLANRSTQGLTKELARQKDTEADLRRQLNELRKRVGDVQVNSTLAVNELKQLANRSTQGTPAPSAHLEGAVYRFVVWKEKNTVLTAWNPNSANSHLMHGFVFIGGTLQVPRDGRYYVYLQLYFVAAPPGGMHAFVVVATKSRRLLVIQRNLRNGEEKTVFTGGLFQLKAGEQIGVVKFNTGAIKMLLRPHSSYFGAYMI